MRVHFVQSGFASLVAALGMLGVVAPVAAGQPGDLDPAFGDHGRLSPIPGTSGTARSIDLLDTGGFVVGGGRFFLWRTSDWDSPRPTCGRSIGNFATLLGEGGDVVGALESADLAAIEIFAIASQADGGVVAVGREVDGPASSCLLSRTLVAFRFKADGSLDTGFGSSGIFRVNLEHNSWASAVRVEPDGRIVVAGAAVVEVPGAFETKLLVLRLLSDGSLDPGFAEQGVLIGPDISFNDPVHLLRTGSGQFRISAAGSETCLVVGVTADGDMDAAFGNAGIRNILTSHLKPFRCGSGDLAADGSLLLAGGEIVSNDDVEGERLAGYALRLLPDGALDRAFVPDAAIADALTEVSSIASTADGKVLVAGYGQERGSILRLQPSGALDGGFGDGGRAWIDLLSDYSAAPVVRDMAVRQDGSVIAVGSNGEPFVVRLLGDAGGTSAGVLGFTSEVSTVLESDGQAVVHVRRTGGHDGAVSVAYRTVANSEAVAGVDFTPASGTLHWADGDVSEREFTVEILADDGPAEDIEAFALELEDPQGSAGLGRRASVVHILPDGAPAGQIAFFSTEQEITEGSGDLLTLERRHYFEGRVCVTVTPKPGTATADVDFDSAAVTVCWEDQESGLRQFEVPIVNDDDLEEIENFTLELSNPTGGAILGQQTTATVTLYDNDVVVTPPPPPPPNDPASGGGGPAGPAELLLLFSLLLLRAGVRTSRLKTSLWRIS